MTAAGSEFGGPCLTNMISSSFTVEMSDFLLAELEAQQYIAD